MRPLEKVTDYLWELPASYKPGMRVPGRIYATEEMLDHIVGDNCLEQVANVAFLPGIQKYSLAMPDIHWGYGFPIGGCCATDPNEGGVISPGGVGYDINCGVRLMRTNLKGEEYLSSMRCAANYAFANRQVLMAKAERAFQHALRISPAELGMELVYDVPHNIAKLEEHGGKTVCVHRKGATRAFPPGHAMIPGRYREIGQPVLVPGDMGRYSFVLVGAPGAMEQTWGTVCHGAGRMMSRARAKKEHTFQDLQDEMTRRGVYMMAQGRGTALEEAPWAYKDVENVVDVCHNAGLARKVARLRPIGVVKG